MRNVFHTVFTNVHDDILKRSSMSNNVLSDILQMTGIMTEEDAAEANQEEEETISEPQKCTTTLQKGM